MLSAVSDALLRFISLLGQLCNSLISNTAGKGYNLSWLRNGLAIGICVAIVFMALRLIKGTIWGR